MLSTQTSSVYISDAWVAAELFQECFFPLIHSKTTDFLKGKSLPLKALLLLDNAPANSFADLLQSDDSSFKCVFFTTSLIQPMYQRVLESTKQQYRKELLKKLLLADTTVTNTPELTIIEFWKELNIKYALFMAAEAWNDVQRSTVTSKLDKNFLLKRLAVLKVLWIQHLFLTL